MNKKTIWFTGTISNHLGLAMAIDAAETRAAQATSYQMSDILRSAGLSEEIRFIINDDYVSVAQKEAAARIASDETILELARRISRQDQTLIGEYLWIHHPGAKAHSGTIASIDSRVITFKYFGIHNPVVSLSDLLEIDGIEAVLTNNKNNADDIIRSPYS